MKSRGFTLIELLVVIATISLLSAVVMVSLTGVRNRGQNARIQSLTVQIRVALEKEYTGFSYPSLTGAGYIAERPTSPNILAPLMDDLLTQAGGAYGIANVSCASGNCVVVITKDQNNPATIGYAIYVKLPGGGVMCLDSRSNARSTDADYPIASPNTDTVATTCQ